MKLSNIKIVYSSDQFCDDEIFDIELSKEVIEGILARIAELKTLQGTLGGNDQICYFPTTEPECSVGRLTCIRISPDETQSFMFHLEDADDYVFESEWLPVEALTKERFLLCDTGDGIIEFDPEEDINSIDDFMAVYADGLEAAMKNLTNK